MSPASQRRSAGRLRVVAVTYRVAFEFARTYDRQLAPPQGHRFSLALSTVDGQLVGVAMVGRPMTQYLDDGTTAELTMLLSDANRRRGLALLGAVWRIARAMGYRRLVTFTGPDESGAGVRGAGWHLVAQLPQGGGRGTPSRPHRRSAAEDTVRVLWQISVAGRRTRRRQRRSSRAAEPFTHGDQRVGVR